MSVAATLEIPVELYNRINQLAMVKETPVADVLDEAVALVESQTFELSRSEAVREEGMARRSIRESAAIRREEMAYRAMHSELFEKYAGQYVAIFQGELVDVDADEMALYSRIDERFPHEIVLLKQVRELPEPDLYVPSFRLLPEA